MKNLVIIGAGPAGLTAAEELLKHTEEYQVTILEATSDIGGISKTVSYGNNRMDIGGHRFFSKDQRMMQWWTDHLPIQGAPAMDDKVLHREYRIAKKGPDPEKENQVMLIRHRVSRIYYKKHFFDYPISLSFQTIRNMGFGTTIVAGCSYLKAMIFKKKEDSLENFYINRFGRKLYSMFFEGYTEKLWGRHPSVISADWGAQRVKGLSILAVLKDVFGRLKPGKGKRQVETSLIEEFYYPKFGPGQLWETVAQDVVALGGKIIMNAKVTNILIKDKNIQGVSYIDECGQRKTIKADVCISSMPVKDLVHALPNVPKKIQEISNGLPYRDFVTVGLLVDRLELKNETVIKTLGNIVPDCWIYVQDTNVKLGRIQIFNNWSPYMVENPENEVWIGLEYFCQEQDEFWNMSEQECIAFAQNELIKMGVLNAKTIIKGAHRERVQKAYPAYFDTYNQMAEVIDYMEQMKDLYCIGRNGQHRYNNMDHSMATAFETVEHILKPQKTKAHIWEVNTEKEYHETTT